MQRKIVPDIVKEQSLSCLAPSATVEDAVKLMTEKRIGAILVTEADKLVGIFTERDVVQRVVGNNLSASDTALSDVMTANPDSVTPNSPAAEALERMVTKGYRHLPVLDGDKIVAIVSIRDLFGAVKTELEQDIKQRDQLIFDTGYGGT